MDMVWIVLIGLLTTQESGKSPEPWWAFEALNSPPVPPGFDARHPIDSFILARLAGKGLSPSHGADRQTLIRRLTFDLVGLLEERT